MKIIKLWFVLDPKHTLQEIVDCWESRTGDLLFPTEETLTAFSNDSFIQPATPSMQKSKPVSISMTGNAEILNRPYGLKLHPDFLINQFQQAEFPTDYPPSAPNELRWSNVFPFSLDVVRDIVYEKPYASVTFNLSLGTFGARHLEVKALAEVLREDMRAQGPSLRLEAVAAAAEKASQEIKAWETGIDFSPLVEKIWQAALATATTLGPDGHLSLLSIDDVSAPADLTLGSPSPRLPEIYRPNLQAFIAEAWTSRFDYCLESERAVRYFGTRKSTELWKQVYRNCMRARKSTWPAVVEILSQDPVSDSDLDAILGFLADINWPGAGEAWTYILSLKKKALPAIDASIARAKACNDDWWLNALETIREMVSTEQDS